MRIALGIEYDGTAYYGWQQQRSGNTVQQSLEAALSQVANQPVKTTCAGRTDTGVHATGQVVHFDTGVYREPRAWIMGVNSNLPADIRVTWTCEPGDDFHARFSARRRHYRYVILNEQHGSALLDKRVCREHAELDVCRMREAAGHLLGEHDFTSFRAVACQARHPVRTIYTLDITRTGRFIYLDIEANAFLHHMVRCIAGVLLRIGRDDANPDWARDLLEVRDRTAGGVTAPAAGLYLVAIRYPSRYELPVSGWLPEYGQ
ncbi:MAG: tRNA pseudouridine(38-40) synthase TruA [Thiohalobacterales bacterium]